MIQLPNWGKDHWSTFAYAETLAVDNKGHHSRNHENENQPYDAS